MNELDESKRKRAIARGDTKTVHKLRVERRRKNRNKRRNERRHLAKRLR